MEGELEIVDNSDDLALMQALARRLWSPASRWHVGDLAWMRVQNVGRTRFWERGGEVVAWGWERSPGDLHVQVDPAHADVMDEVLEWFESAGTVTVLDAETWLFPALARHGYREADGVFFAHMGMELRGLGGGVAPEGYGLRAVRGEVDAEARAAAHREAFPQPWVTTESYLQVMRTWPYRAELDWVVEADGEPVAFCLVWLDEVNQVAVLEPVGTHPEHRRKGLASAAVRAALGAAAELGARTARVCARGDAAYPMARATYEAVGFRAYARNLSFVKASG